MAIDQVIEIGVLVVILCLSLTIYFLHQHNLDLVSEVADYQAQIDQLHADAIKAAQEAAQAKVVADRIVAGAKMRSSQVMKEKIPNGCQNAISWMVSQAPSI